MIDNNLLKEAIADAKAKRQTELAWCKCVEDCMCDHCKPLKLRLAVAQAKEKYGEDFNAGIEMRFVTELDTGKYVMRNQTHTLSDRVLTKVIVKVSRDMVEEAFSESFEDRFNERIFQERFEKKLQPPDPMTEKQLDEIIAELEKELPYE